LEQWALHAEMQTIPHLLNGSRAVRIGIDPKETAATAGSRLSDSLGLMFGFKADLTLPYFTSLYEEIMLLLP
jgi:hypothetical protein